MAVSVRADGYVSRSANFRPGDAVPDEYTFALEKGSTIGGYVHDQAGKPIGDVQLTIFVTLAVEPKLTDRDRLNTSIITQTDASGHWACNEVPSNPSMIRLRLVHPEYISCDYWTQSYPTEGPSGQKIQPIAMIELRAGKAVMVMQYGFLVMGIVNDENGKALAGAAVSEIERGQALSTVSTGLDGRFAFTASRLGEMVLRAQAKGFAAEARTIQVVARMPDIEFRLAKGQIVRGSVVDDKGNPVVGADIRAEPSNLFEDLIVPWQAKTDSTGRFLWDSAPARALGYFVSAAGFKPSGSLVLEPSEDHEIRLHRLSVMRVSGKVVDAETNMPIEDFKVVASPDWSVFPAAAEGKNGEFTLSLDERYPKYNIRAEAAGYRPDTQSVEFKEGDWKLEFSLGRGTGPSGIVKLPGGEPVVGASVYLCGASKPGAAAATMTGIKSVRGGSGSSQFFAASTTDEAGRFSFAPMPEAQEVIATHEKGYAAVKVEDLTSSETVTLQPWGRVEGTLRIGSKSGADQPVRLWTLVAADRLPRLNVSLSVQTDAEGKFVFQTVPAGEYHISWAQTGANETQSANATIQAGQTVAVKLGGMGRPVVGNVLVAGADSPIDWKRASSSIELKVPTLHQPSQQDRQAYSAWLQTEDGKSWSRSRRTYFFVVAADGSFRVEDIPAGTYVLKIGVMVGSLDARRYAEFTKEFVVPEMPGGRSDTPLDLGTVTLQIAGKQGEYQRGT